MLSARSQGCESRFSRAGDSIQGKENVSFLSHGDGGKGGASDRARMGGCHVSSFNVCHRLRIRALPVSEMMPFRSPTVGRNRAISPANPMRWSMSLRGSAVLPQRQPDDFPGWPLAWVSSRPPWHGGVGAQRLRGQCVALEWARSTWRTGAAVTTVYRACSVHSWRAIRLVGPPGLAGCVPITAHMWATDWRRIGGTSQTPFQSALFSHFCPDRRGLGGWVELNGQPWCPAEPIASPSSPPSISSVPSHPSL